MTNTVTGSYRNTSPFENHCFKEIGGGSEAGTYLRLIHFVHHPTLGLRVMMKKKRREQLQCMLRYQTLFGFLPVPNEAGLTGSTAGGQTPARTAISDLGVGQRLRFSEIKRFSTDSLALEKPEMSTTEVSG